MRFENARTWPGRGRQVQEVKDKCERIRLALELPETDARVQGVVHVRQACNTLAAIPIKLQQSAETRGNVPFLVGLLGLQGEGDLVTVLTDLNRNAKAGFLTVCQFALENSARSVVCAITGEEPPYKYKDLSRRLIEACELSDPDRRHETLLLLAYLRNTLHANGVHTWPDVTIEVQGAKYVFERNSRVECASWSHVLYAVFHSLCVYEAAYLSPRVVAVEAIPVA